MTAQEPQTKAGRALLDNPGGTREVRAWAIRKVESEAREQAERDIAALREALAEIRDWPAVIPDHPHGGVWPPYIPWNDVRHLWEPFLRDSEE
jgi:hypothetical protein